jgi:hypothetical protein
MVAHFAQNGVMRRLTGMAYAVGAEEAPDLPRDVDAGRLSGVERTAVAPEQRPYNSRTTRGAGLDWAGPARQPSSFAHAWT